MNGRESRLRLVEAGTLEPSDDALMVRAAAGDRSAFRELVLRHEQSVRRLSRSITKDDASARDAAQECFLKLWLQRERYQPSGRFKAYLFTIARNACRSHVRRQGIRSWFGAAPATESSAEDLLLEREAADLSTAALDRLPEKFRTPIVLRFIEGLDYDEIAAVIGRTPSAARSRVHYGLRALRAQLPREVIE